MIDRRHPAPRPPAVRLLRVAAGCVPALGLWLVPGSPIAAVVVVLIAAAAALHGLGRIAGRIAGDDDAPAVLAMAWGLAAYLAIAGAVMMIGGWLPAVRTALAAIGCAAGALWLGRTPTARPIGHAIDDRRRRLASAILPAMLVSALATIHAVGSAGMPPEIASRDGSGLAARARLDDTGGLGDGVSEPRLAGLGAGVAVAGLAPGLAPATSSAVEAGLLFGLFLAWIVWIARRAGSDLAALIVPALVTAMPAVRDDPALPWSLIVLVAAGISTLERAVDRRNTGLLALVAGAAATVRHPGAAVAVALLIPALRAQWRWPGGRRGLAIAVALAAAVVAPYLIDAARGWLSAADGAVLAGLPMLAGARIAMWAAAAGAVGWLVDRMLAAATAPRATWAVRAGLRAVAAGIAAAGLLPGPGDAVYVASALATVLVAVLAVVALAAPRDAEPGDRARLDDDDDHDHDGDGRDGDDNAGADDDARATVPGDPDRRPPRPALAVTVTVAVALCAVLTLARFASGRPALSWPARLGRYLSDARALAARPQPDRERGLYRDAQRTVPAGAGLGLWVDRPDRVDHRGHRVVDLRTAAAARRCRLASTGARAAACRDADRWLTATGVGYLLVATPALEPCAGDGCRDPIQRRIDAGTVRFDRDGLRVIELGASAR